MRQTLSQSVAAQLMAAVAAGEYRVGDKLPPERELMENFGVGRNTVREAIQSLVARGICEVRPGRGTTVLRIDGRSALEGQNLSSLLADSAIDDLYEFRMLLETDAAARAAERADDDDRASILEALRRYEDAATSQSGTYRRDVEFHAAIARASHNTAYAAALDAVASTLVEIRRATDEVPGAIEQAVIEHGHIARYILDGNQAAARAAMTMHIQTAFQTLSAAREAERGADGDGAA
ncbi:FadR/GntR family transcriptional regulator [Herbiconiux sp. YIM B11900]|uniref:FadR/GntR family transcriptional regulator n=1 Tax=Herbiconiux sp. YIM B11900 TaxID=3404131 RepID=UPI003F85ECE7